MNASDKIAALTELTSPEGYTTNNIMNCDKFYEGNRTTRENGLAKLDM